MNSIDVSKKIQFAICHPTDGTLKFLDLTLSVDVTLKHILVDLFKSNQFLVNLNFVNKALNSVKDEVTLKSILTLGSCAVPVETLGTSKNCLLTLRGL